MCAQYVRSGSELPFQQPCGIKVSFSLICLQNLLYFAFAVKDEKLLHVAHWVVLCSASVPGFYSPLILLILMLQKSFFFLCLGSPKQLSSLKDSLATVSSFLFLLMKHQSLFFWDWRWCFHKNREDTNL